MIKSFRHAGLKRFYERGDRRRLLAEHVPKIARVLAQLDIATDPNDMDLPGFRLHPLTGQPCRILDRHCSCQLADYFPL
jgi:proteic killer suppression protein